MRLSGPSAKARRRQQRVLREALRCTVVRHLTEKAYRRFSQRLAESALLRWFCGIERLEKVRVQAKSSVHRYETLVPEEMLRALIQGLSLGG